MKTSNVCFKTVIKCIWYILVIVFTSAYLYRNLDTVVLTIRQLSWEKIVFALIALILGKICLSFNMKYSLRSIDKHFPFITCFHIYNISQLGKYAPGNFWHFIGRIGFYKNLNLSFKEIRSTMILEILFIIIGSFCFGLLFLFFSPDFLKIFSEYYPSSKIIMMAVVPGVIFSIGLIAIIKKQFFAKVLRTINENRILNIKITAIQFMIWLSLGLSFYFVVSPYESGIKVSALTTGLFALAYLIGFLFVIAPAGIGVREFVLVSGLSLINVSPDVAISVVGVHRMLYIIAEVFLATMGSLLFSYFQRRPGLPKTGRLSGG